MFFKLMYITNNLDVALIAQRYGVDRIWIDLEVIGKDARQKGLDSVKSQHQIADIARIKPHLTTASMLVRVNPWHRGSAAEINAVIAAGADIIMLPYWKTVAEVQRFIAAVNGRSRTTLLLETKEAVEILEHILQLSGVDEIHIGLNDLHLSYGMDFMFELLSNGTVERLCSRLAAAGIPYGFGGIAKLGEGLIPAEKIVMEHYRLGSTRVILSRSFCDFSKIAKIDEIDRIFRENMQALRAYEKSISLKTPEEFTQNKVEIAQGVAQIVDNIRRARSNAE